MLAHKKSMKIKAGVKFEIGKIKIDAFQDEHTEKDKDYIEDKQTLIWSTNPKPCTKANINSQIDSQFAYLKKRFDKLSDYVEGSGWIIYRWHYIFVECLTVKPQRGSSYIPTPAKYSNPQCGLINIQNKDQECFKWCMKYHQSEQKKHGERTTVLEKLPDKYIYNISYPTPFVEIDNQVSVFVYYVSDDDAIRTERKGNPDYILDDVNYLL